MDYVREWKSDVQNCWCASVREAKAIDLNVRSVIPTDNVDAAGTVVYARSVIASIAEHEKRRRIVAEKGYRVYFKESQIRESHPTRCRTICRPAKGAAKKLLEQYLVDMRSDAETQFWAYWNTEQASINVENNHWLADATGLLTGYNSAHIHNPGEQPAFVPPACPAA